MADAPAAPDVDALLARLARALPEPRCELDYRSPWQLLVATILSAQSTDRTVNAVTPALFARWPDPPALAAAAQEEVEDVVRSTGFFRNKAKAIIGASRELVARFGGEVPADLEALVTLPGVARKTANLVLGEALGVASGMVVDTHVKRVAGRLGLTEEAKPERIEADLCGRIARDAWIATSHRLLLHGRYLCTARGPDCPACPVNELCPSREAAPEGPWEARADAEAGRVAGA